MSHLIVGLSFFLAVVLYCLPLFSRNERGGLVRRASNVVCRLWFGVTLFFAFGWLYCLTGIVQLMGGDRFTKENRCSWSSGVVLSLWLKCNPHIRLMDSSPSRHQQWERMMQSCDRGALLLINHISYSDALLFASLCPPRLLRKLRTLMKGSLLRLKVFGRIASRAGHFPVFFKCNTLNDFSVDRERMEEVMKGVNEHLSRGGVLGFFPEGQINRQSPSTLQTFRRGSFQLAVDHQLPIWGCLCTGAERVWPPGCWFGGYPADIRLHIFPIVTAPQLGDLKSLPVICRDEMQKKLSALHSLSPSSSSIAENAKEE